MKIPIGICNSHVHLNKEDIKILIGHPLTFRKKLLQPSAFAAEEQIMVNGLPVRCIGGDIREFSFVELIEEHCQLLNLTLPHRSTNDIGGAPYVQVVGPTGKSIWIPAIIPLEHLHMPESERDKFKSKIVSVEINYNTTVYNQYVNGYERKNMSFQYFTRIKFGSRAVPEFHINKDVFRKLNEYYRGIGEVCFK